MIGGLKATKLNSGAVFGVGWAAANSFLFPVLPCGDLHNFDGEEEEGNKEGITLSERS